MGIVAGGAEKEIIIPTIINCCSFKIVIDGRDLL